MSDLFTYISRGGDLTAIVNDRNKCPNNKSSLFDFNKGFLVKALASIKLLNAGYTALIDGIQYDAVIYMGNENISFYIMKTTQVISFAFTGCYLAVCRCDSAYVAFHIPPNMYQHFIELSKNIGLHICIIYNPMKLITGGKPIDSTPKTPKIWGIVDTKLRKISAIEITEYLKDKKVKSFEIADGNRCEIRDLFRHLSIW